MDRLIDRHGFIDFRQENFENIWFDKSKEGAEIYGCSINCLLYGLFLINGYSDELRKLPGGISCWDVILESLYITLSTIVTPYEIIARLDLLVEEYLQLKYKNNNRINNFDISSPLISTMKSPMKSPMKRNETTELMKTSNILYGALVSLYTWLANFNTYITDSQLRILHHGIVSLGNTGLRQIITSPNLNDKNSQNIDECGDLYRRLEVLTDIISSERCRLLIGVKSQQSISKEYSNSLHLSKYNPILYDFINERIIQNPYEYVYHNRNYMFHNSSSTLPSMNIIKGNWDITTKIQKQQEIQKALDNAPKFQLNIFGMDNLMNTFDDSDDDGNTNNVFAAKSSNSQPINEYEEKLKNRPQSLVPLGMSLVSSLFTETELWSFELLEIARQLTLIDHSIFCAIPLQSLILSSWSNPRHMMTAIHYKKMNDRFNTLSLWSTSCVLNENTIENRAKKYEQIVLLSSHLMDLCNYNCAMALITSLQQGCITRLKDTLALVTSKTKETFKSVQVLNFLIQINMIN